MLFLGGVGNTPAELIFLIQSADYKIRVWNRLVHALGYEGMVGAALGIDWEHYWGKVLAV